MQIMDSNKEAYAWIETYKNIPEQDVLVMATYDYEHEFQAMICHGKWFHKTETIATPLAWRNEV